MRHKALLLAASVVIGMLLLTACTSSDGQIVQNTGAGTTQEMDSADNQVGGGSGTDTQDSWGAVQDNSGTVQDNSGMTQDNSGAAQATSGTIQNPDSDNISGGVSDQTAGQPDEALQSESQKESTDGAGSETELPELPENTSGEKTGTEDIWSGVYKAEQETVTVAFVDAQSISFSFAQSGISGVAAVDGYQAVYKGDDYHVVVFNLNNDVISVSVSSEEDYDASGSPLIGTYVKQ